ncbi:MAG: polysaccharide deacetylase family protein [Aeromicrobium sp.]
MRGVSLVAAVAMYTAHLAGASVNSPGERVAPDHVGQRAAAWSESARSNLNPVSAGLVRLNGDAPPATRALLDRTATEPIRRSSVPQGPPPVPGPVAYLTFDDGPDPAFTPAVLNLLARYRARATFFLVGEHVQQFPDLVRQEVAAGNAIGNHTVDHQVLAGLDEAQFDAQVIPMKRLLGPGATDYLRPPYGAVDPSTSRYAAVDGYRLQLWDVDTRDWNRPGVPTIVGNALSGVHPGAVILMHDGGGDRSQTVAALDQILRTLTSQGWRFLPLDSSAAS